MNGFLTIFAAVLAAQAVVMLVYFTWSFSIAKRRATAAAKACVFCGHQRRRHMVSDWDEPGTAPCEVACFACQHEEIRRRKESPGFGR